MSELEDPISIEEELSAYIADYSYWAENLFMIRDKRNELIPLKLNRVQQRIGEVEQEELRLHGQARLFILKARQGGVSTDQQARSLHKIWSTPGTVALTLAHSRDDTDKIFQITKRAIQNFDKGMLPTLGRSAAREVTFPELDSSFWTGTAGSTRVGRGITVTRLHGSEFAFWPNPKSVLGSVSPSLIPVGSVVALETTPDAYESEAHRFWRDSKAGETGYRTLFFPWWECDPVFYRIAVGSEEESKEVLKSLTPEEKFLVEKFNLDLGQIKWRRSKIKELGRSQFLREYPEDDETCWLIAGDKFFEADVIQELLPKASVPVKISPDKRLHYFSDQVVQTKIGKITEDVIIGCDVSEGTGLDRSAWVARSYPSWRLLTQFADKKTEPDELADFLERWGKKYGGALLVVEKNAHGITVLRRLRDKLDYPLKSIFHRTSLLQNVDLNTDYIGWATTGESLPLLLDYGRQILKSAKEGIIQTPSRECLIDFASVPSSGSQSAKLTGKDVLVAEMLAWAGREYLVKSKVSVLRPYHPN